MDAVAYIAIAGAFIVLAVGGWLIAAKFHELETQVKALWPLEQEVADQNEAIKRLRVDKAAQDRIIELQREAIEKLQAEIARLDVAWQVKFDTFIALLRKVAPELDIDSILAQLEAVL